MSDESAPNPADFIAPMNMNGLNGRVMRLPASAGKQREILLLYGHHSSLERWFGLAQVLNRYGSVTMPDFPGFGGMDSLYKVGQKPTLDAMADYLATFIKMRYKNRRITIVGLSYGFIVATRMLQRFPEMAQKVDLLISLVGFAHKDDFTFSQPRRFFYLSAIRIVLLPGMPKFFKAVCLHPIILRTFYTRTHNAKRKFEGLSQGIAKQMTEIEIWLWRNNDVRTYMATSLSMLTLDNCGKHIRLPLWHVGVKNDHFFDNNLVEQHLRVIFDEFNGMMIDLTNHAPTVIANEKDAAPFVPAELRKILNE
jgi:pimeloyl-ACP methyl ester carboxylesterase